jgi:hypothetical protein
MGELNLTLDRPYGQTPEAKATAVARVRLEPDAADLLAALGLTDEQVPGAYEVRNGRSYCTRCGQRVRPNGFCRSRKCRGECA